MGKISLPMSVIVEVAGEHQIKDAITLLLEKASYGDPYEMMQGLRHIIEK